MKKIRLFVLAMLTIALFGGLGLNAAFAAAKVKSIEITKLPSKLVYNVGDGYSTKGMVVEATMTDGKKVTVANSEITSFSGVTLTEGRAFQQEGKKTVEIKYQDAKATFEIAVFDPKKEYYITFDSNGGSKVDRIKIDASTKSLELPTPTLKGAKFLGWYNGNTKVAKFKPGMGPSLSLKAKWGYEITFNANGGEGKMDKGYISNDYKLPKSKFTRKGYKFVGWSTKKAADDTSFFEVGDISSDVSYKNEAVTLYAQWVKEGTYKISYTSVKGVKLPTNAIKKYKSGTTTPLPYPDLSAYPSKSVVGVSFMGWEITANGKKLGIFIEIPPYISGDIKVKPLIYELEG